jgi:hypothetical protein
LTEEAPRESINAIDIEEPNNKKAVLRAMKEKARDILET